MDRRKRKIGIAIMIVIILICLCIGLLYMTNKNSSEIDKVDGVLEGDGTPNYEVQKIKDPSKFFTIEACIQNNSNDSFKAKDMNVLEGDIIYSYAVYGTIENKEEAYFIVRVDMDKATFVIEELENRYQNIDQINLETDLQEIKENGKNTIEFMTMTEEDICRMYLKHYTTLELENVEEAYKLIDEKYKAERFSNLDEYKEYVEEYKGIIEEGILTKYLVNYYDDYIEYVLVDNYNTSYTIKAKGVYDYTIYLDNYTVKVENFEKDYQNLNSTDKVQSNVYIFLQMINTKDYKHAYALLDDTFKNNNFATLEDFKQYVKNNFFSYNLNAAEIEIKEEGNYYIYETTLKENASSAAEEKKFTVIMKLEEGTDFVMSFNIEAEATND